MAFSEMHICRQNLLHSLRKVGCKICTYLTFFDLLHQLAPVWDTAIKEDHSSSSSSRILHTGPGPVLQGGKQCSQNMSSEDGSVILHMSKQCQNAILKFLQSTTIPSQIYSGKTPPLPKKAPEEVK